MVDTIAQFDLSFPESFSKPVADAMRWWLAQGASFSTLNINVPGLPPGISPVIAGSPVDPNTLDDPTAIVEAWKPFVLAVNDAYQRYLQNKQLDTTRTQVRAGLDTMTLTPKVPPTP